jgi:hypothetical protein
MLRAASDIRPHRRKGDEMKRRSTILLAVPMTVALAGFAGLGCAPDADGGGDVCSQITGYTASTTAPVSFATDIMPILVDTSLPAGCGQPSICHGSVPSGLDDVFVGTQFLQFLYDPANPAMARANLLMPSYRSTMARVTPGNVGQSFLAYKIWDKERRGLACVASSCPTKASASDTLPCGDQMPSVGDLPIASRNKILDWIAKGALE